MCSILLSRRWADAVPRQSSVSRRSAFWACTAVTLTAGLRPGAAGRQRGRRSIPSKLFATSCGWCHQSGGRVEGRGPKLAGSEKSDEFIINRIKNGKSPGMPAFGRSFNDDQIKTILGYIRGLQAALERAAREWSSSITGIGAACSPRPPQPQSRRAACRRVRSKRFSRRGTITLCAHANALPFASRKNNPPGFQIELGRALAKQLGVELDVAWVVSADPVSRRRLRHRLRHHRRCRACRSRRACASRGRIIAAASRLPCRRARTGSAPSATRCRAADRRPGGLGGADDSWTSAASPLSPFGFEDEIIEELSAGSLAGAAVSPATIGYFNLTNPTRAVRLVHAYEA